jgi:DNA polymerase-1
MSVPFHATDWYALERDLLSTTLRIEAAGFPMNRSKAQALLAELQDAEAENAAALQLMLPPQDEIEVFIPKRNNKTKNYVAGVPFHKHREVGFNPASGAQFHSRMLVRYGVWPSTVTTKTGAPSVTAAVLATLPWPEAETLHHLKVATKRVGMLSGPNGFLTKLADDDRLHTVYHTLGTITGRCSHAPNAAQVPAIQKQKVQQPDGSTVEEPLIGASGAWGVEFRRLFHAPDGWTLVGVDLKGLEARVLAHYLAIWDGGDYARLVTGGADLHAINQLNTGTSTRAAAKRLFFATIFGCGNRKAGTIVDPSEDDDATLTQLGKITKDALIAGITGFAELFQWLDAMPDDALPGLDGRPIFGRKRHARVNTIIQSAGAIISKRWIVLTDQALHDAGLRWDTDFQIAAWVHDELVIACRPEIAEQIAEIAKRCAVLAGEYYHLDCPMAADAHIGSTWADVH